MSKTIHLLAPLVYFYDEEYAEDPAENTPDEFDFGHGYKLVKIDKYKVVKPLLDDEHTGQVLSKYVSDLIMDFSSHAIRKDYKLTNTEVMHVVSAHNSQEAHRLLLILKMALGVAKRSHLIFQEFHLNEDGRSAWSTSLGLEGSHWDAQSYYPEENDVSFRKSDLELTKRVFDHLIELSDEYSRVFNACYYFEMARLKGDGDYRLKFTFLVTSLESIFNTSPNQITETLAIRYTRMIYSGPKERLKVYKDLRDIYKLRSHMIHGQQIPKKFMERKLQDDLLGKLEFYTRKAILYIINNGLVDTINGSDVDDYFTNLSLGIEPE